MYSFVYLDRNQWYGVTQNGQALWFYSEDQAMRAAEAHWRQEGRAEYAIVTDRRNYLWYGRPGQGWCSDRSFPSAAMEDLYPRNAQWRRWGG
ncbi:hypothetical protein WI697_26460 [Tistrella mobilis]|uniref:hypothetical protein n=2 Tax=Tistrella mobilis TaxID=171437 RepID=UPI0031F6E55D